MKLKYSVLNGLLLMVALKADIGFAKNVQEHVENNLQLQLTLSSKATINPVGDTNTNYRITLRTTDATTHQSVGNINPRAWLSLRRSEQVAVETSCEAKVRSFASGKLTTRADVDLNSYLLITLNQDKTVALINPQISWSNSQLAGIVQLPEQGLDWVLTKDGKWLYVTMPEASAVALIDATTHSLVTTIATGSGSKPTRIALTPDEQSLWVGLDHTPTIAVFDRGEKPKVKIVSVNEGLHQISFTPDSRIAVVTNTAANTVSILDATTQKKLGDIEVPNTPLKAVWVEKAERFYVSSLNDTQLRVIDPDKRVVDGQIEVGRGIVDIASDPQGRYLWVVNQLEAKTTVIDSATNTKVAFANVTAEPDQIAFTADYAYFRGLGSEKFALVNRKQLERIAGGKPGEKIIELSVTQIQAGEKAPATLPDAVGVAAMIVSVPEQNGVMIASAPGRTIYYYVEGMMVPMGTFDNYRRIPRALMILNRSLQETAPGVFEAPVSIEKTGNYDIAVMIDQPRLLHCFTAKFEGEFNNDKQKEQTKIMLELLPLKDQPHASAETFISYKLRDASTKQPVTGIQDARLLAFEPPGLWQKREWLQEVEKGIYQATVIFPHAGRFNLLIEALSKRLEFTGQSLQMVEVQDSLPKSQRLEQK
ncbi:MAG: YncE family protein [Methylococcaceae bacterium]|nr:YncE family protein [Methylococcaceae bacterium]